MRERSATPGAVAARSVAVVAAIAINVGMQVSGFLAAPDYLRPDPTWVTVHLFVAVVFGRSRGLRLSRCQDIRETR